jgi:Cu/Ag efflux protein CusF
MSIRRKLNLAILAITCLMAFAAFGQQSAKKKEYILAGTVEAVNTSAGKLTVNHGKVEGWMDAMTMAYPVDKPGILKNIKAGDQIKATVFDGDMTLHNVQVVPPKKPKK